MQEWTFSTREGMNQVLCDEEGRHFFSFPLRRSFRSKKPSLQVLLIHSFVNKGKRWAFFSSPSSPSFSSLSLFFSLSLSLSFSIFLSEPLLPSLWSLVCRANNVYARIGRDWAWTVAWVTHDSFLLLYCFLFQNSFSLSLFLIWIFFLTDCCRCSREKDERCDMKCVK